jgi:hypothetical protein
MFPGQRDILVYEPIQIGSKHVVEHLKIALKIHSYALFSVMTKK